MSTVVKFCQIKLWAAEVCLVFFTGPTSVLIAGIKKPLTPVEIIGKGYYNNDNGHYKHHKKVAWGPPASIIRL